MRILITKYNPSMQLYSSKDDAMNYQFHSFIQTEFAPEHLGGFDTYDVVCLFSHSAVDWVLKHACNTFENCRFIALTQKQCGRLKSAGLTANAPEHGVQYEMTALVLEHNGSGRVLILKGDRSMENVSDALSDRGVVVEQRMVYKTVLQPHHVNVRGNDAVLFYSPSGVEGFLKGHNRLQKTCKIFAIGPTTAKAVREKLNTDVTVSPIQEEAAFIEFVRNELSGSKK